MYNFMNSGQLQIEIFGSKYKKKKKSLKVFVSRSFPL